MQPATTPASRPPRPDSGSSGDPLDTIRSARRAAEALRAFRRAAAAVEIPGLGVEPLAADAIDGFRIVGVLGGGGQGVVHEAIETKSGERRAIKVLRHSSLTRPQDRYRFERETQILGELRHPHVVSVRGAGIAGGRPYLVMDYIEGRPIDEHVSTTRPPIADALRLFATVCDAVHAAHVRGISHRDIKPRNVLVDAAGRPFVVDFGLAKLVERDAEATDSGAATLTGQFVGTPIWASPEQTEAGSGLVDLRTDVYSLGLVLYRLLTGSMPYETGGSQTEVFQRIRQTPPTPPRQRRPELDKDLETIVLKCLAKEPPRRYQTAGELARDVRRFLGREPIDARRDSAGYLLRKLVARHRVATAATVSMFLGIVGGGTAAFLYARQEANKAVQETARADQEAERADRAERSAGVYRAFLRGLVLLDTPGVSLAAARKALDIAAAEVEPHLALDPALACDVHVALANRYGQVGDSHAYAFHAAAAEESARTAYGPNDPRFIDALSVSIWHCPSDPMLAERLKRESLRLLEGPLETRSEIAVRYMLAYTLLDEDYPEALRQYDLIAQLLVEFEPGDRAHHLRGIGDTLSIRQFHRDAELHYREALSLARGQVSNYPLGHYLNAHGVALTRLGRLDEAEAVLREALELRRRVHQKEDSVSFYLQVTMAEMGEVLRRSGRYAEAESFLKDAYDAFRTPPHVNLREFRRKIAWRLVRLYDKWDAAEPGRGYADKAAEWRIRMSVLEP